MFKMFYMSVIIYLYLAVLLRIMGKKEFSKLNVFDFVVFLIMAEIITMSLESDKIGIIDAIIATTTLVVIDRIETYITMHSKKVRDILEGTPAYLIFNNKILISKMKELRYSIDDLNYQLRVNNIDDVSNVMFAILEKNGDVSIITKDDNNVIIPESLINDGVINHHALKLINKDVNWLKKELKKKHIHKMEDVFYCLYRKDGLYIIKNNTN